MTKNKDLYRIRKGKIRIIIETLDKKFREEINAEINPNFNDAHEIVVRKTDFISARTLGIKADKAAIGLNRGIIEMLKNKK